MNRMPGRMAIAAAVCLIAPAAPAQTTAGTSTTIVVPVVAQTGSFVSDVTLFNPNGADITVDVRYYDANNLASAGPKTCAPVIVPAGRSVPFGLGGPYGIGGPCTLEAGSHFGLLVLAEQSQSLEFHGYVRTQTPQGIGFSTEGFPIDHFNATTQHATGLKKAPAGGGMPAFQTNCFVATLGSPVNYELRLYDGSSNTQIGSTLAGSLAANQQLRYLDVFSAFPNGVGAPGTSYGNVRAQFTNLTGNGVPMIGFCTVQENQSFAADFRIAKAYSASVSLPADVFVQNGNAFGATAILGTNDNFPLEFRGNGARMMRYEPNSATPNLIGGHASNSVAAGQIGATIAGGGAAGDFCSAPWGENLPCANRVLGSYTTIGGGKVNTAVGAWSTIAGGIYNSTGQNGGTVAGGTYNTAGGEASTVGGGSFNGAGGAISAVGGGTQNHAYGGLATIGGGSANVAYSGHATIGGGWQNTASGQYATVPGGYWNTASGAKSFAAGYRAKTQTAGVTPVAHDGSFVFADSSDFDFNTTASNEFAVRATGGARFITAINGAGAPVAGVAFDSAGNVTATGTFNPPSDVNLKTAFRELTTSDILQRVVTLPIRSWAYKSAPDVRHIGPSAQDFHGAFGVGIDDRHIATVDADGVALAAIQGLHRLLQARDAEISALAGRLARQQAAIEAQNNRLAELGQLVDLLQARTGTDAQHAKGR